MRTDQEKLEAVRKLLKRWRAERAELEKPRDYRHVDLDALEIVQERDEQSLYLIGVAIEELEQAIADEQDTAAPNQDSAEPGTGASG